MEIIFVVLSSVFPKLNIASVLKKPLYACNQQAAQNRILLESEADFGFLESTNPSFELVLQASLKSIVVRLFPESVIYRASALIYSSVAYFIKYRVYEPCKCSCGNYLRNLPVEVHMLALIAATCPHNG